MSAQLQNGVIRAAHPWIAGALAILGRNIADSAEPIVEHPAFLIVGAVAAVGLLWARSQGWVQ